MPGRKLNSLLGLSMSLSLLASCQAVPAGPKAVAVAGSPAAGYDTPAGLRKLLGYSPLLGDPSRQQAAGVPGFALKAGEYLWGVENPISTNTGDQEYVDLAYNSHTSYKNFFAVWQDGRNGASNTDIYGQLLGPIGAVSGSAAAVSADATGMELGPRVVYNSSANEYLVAWTDTHNGSMDVYTQRVSNAGVKAGSPLHVASGAGNQILAGLAYNVSSNQYLVTWVDDASGATLLKGRRISAANGKVGSVDLAISGVAGALAGGGIAVQSGNDYMVVWANGTTPGVYGQLVKKADDGNGNPSDDLSGTAKTIAASASYEYYTPRVAYTSFSGGSLMVTYERRAAGTENADVYWQRLSTAGALVGSAVAATTAAGAQVYPNIASNVAGGGFLLIWSDGRNGSSDLDVYAKMLLSDGTELIPEFVATNYSGTGLQTLPALTFDSVRERFVTLYQDSRGHGSTGWDLRSQRLVSEAMTAEEIMDDTMAELEEAGVTNGNAHAHLANADKFLDQGKPDKAIDFLESFIGFVTGNPDLTAEEEASLIGMAQEAIEQILEQNCTDPGNCD